MWCSYCVAIVLVSVGHIVAGHGLHHPRQPLPSTSDTISHFNINYRQEQPIFGPPETSSSYDYWWPYPPGGVQTSTTTASPALPTPLDYTDSLPATDDSSVITIVLTSDVTSTPDSTSDSPTSTLSTTSSSVPSSIPASSSISTLPSTNTTASPSSVILKAKPRRTFKVIYLVPLFAVLGIILGSLSVWLLYGCLMTRRGPRTRASSLEPGPPYVPTDTEIESDMREVSLHDDDGGSPSKYSLHGSNYPYSRHVSMWFSGARERTEGMEKKFSWPTPSSTCTVKGYQSDEDDPFLASSSANGLVRTGRTKRRSKKLHYSSSRAASPDPLSLVDLDEGEEEEEEEVPFESLRHKSIRRGILERLRFGTLKRGDTVRAERGEAGSVRARGKGSSSFRRMRYAHSRADSDLRVEDVRIPEQSYARADSYRTERDVGGTGVEVDETEWVAGSGFRIVEEHLNAMREQIRGGDWGDADGAEVRRGRESAQSRKNSVSKESARDGTLARGDDKYTALPMRKSPSKAGRPQVGKNMVSSASASARKSLSRADSSVLPLSPPQLTSPPLESKLLFTPTLQQSDSMYLRSMGGGQGGDGGTVSGTKTKRGKRVSGRGANRLQKKLPVVTPGPGRDVGGSSTRRGRGKKDDGVHGGCTLAERYAARQGALAKVEEILCQSWSERDMKGLERVRSPTMFGAVPG